MSLWVRPRALPVDQAETLRGRGRRVLFVFERTSLAVFGLTTRTLPGGDWKGGQGYPGSSYSAWQAAHMWKAAMVVLGRSYGISRMMV